MGTVNAVDQRVLDNPAWASLLGAHARFAEVHGRAARYQSDVSVFHALADPADPRAWSDLAELVGPGAEVAVADAPLTGIPGWESVGSIGGVQYVDVSLRATPDPEAVLLTAADVPEMLDLVRRTEPGPFRPRTIELGTYLGIRRGGALVAMAGERLHPPGWTEISAVCTDPEHRRQGLATRLVRAVADLVRSRGEVPFLHTGAANTRAIDLYLAMGFELRREVEFAAFRAT
jgi:ribosomal protein S18 acetylase RimI-like enzyme